MKQRLVWILGGVMGASIAVLLITQLVWIRNAYDVKQTQFDQIVFQALLNVSNQVSQYERFSFFYEDINNYQFDTSYYTQYKSIDEKTEIRSYHRFSFNVKSNDGNNIIIDEKIEPNKNSKDEIYNVIGGIENRFSSEDLNNIIKNEFHNVGIDLDFEFGLRNPSKHFVVQSEDFNEIQKTFVYKANINSYSLFLEPNQIWVYFPTRGKFLFRSLGFASISSFTLVIILIVLFIFVTMIFVKQKKLNEIKSDFISNMTHELKTPISTISLASQMLKDNSIPEDSKNNEYISTLIHDETMRLGYQVEKVLQTAILDKGRVKLKLKPTDAHNIIENVANNLHLQVDQKGGKLTTDLNASKTIIMVDEVHFSNVLLNLLDNALKYSKESPEISIKTYDEGDNQCAIIIKDNGIGISKKDQKRIFEKFFRVSTGNIHNVKGFGLGLHYVKNIIEEHNASITLNSEMNKGTEFKILFPVHQSE